MLAQLEIVIVMLLLGLHNQGHMAPILRRHHLSPTLVRVVALIEPLWLAHMEADSTAGDVLGLHPQPMPQHTHTPSHLGSKG